MSLFNLFKRRKENKQAIIANRKNLLELKEFLNFEPELIIDEDIESWVAGERRENPKIKKSAFLSILCERLGVGYRHMMRYRTGEAPLPLNKIKRFCETVESTRLIEYLAYQVGMVAVRLPNIEKKDNFNAVKELITNIERYLGLSRQLAQSLEKTPNKKELKAIKDLSREVIGRILSLQAYYEKGVENE